MKNNAHPTEPKGNSEDFVNRKLIRPTLPARTADGAGTGAAAAPAPAREPEAKRERRSSPRQSFAAANEQTHAENFYFQKQMQSQTPMTIVLKNGETIQGVIEWYDTRCIKLARHGRGSVLIYKTGIRYLHKTGE
jgi:RNA chaperone Hfq